MHASLILYRFSTYLGSIFHERISKKPREAPHRGPHLASPHLLPPRLHVAVRERALNWRRIITFSYRLVLGCINTDFRNQILILQHFSRSTKWSSLIFKMFRNFAEILQNFAKFLQNFQESGNFAEILQKLRNFAKFCKSFCKTFAKFCKIKLDHFVDPEKC